MLALTASAQFNGLFQGLSQRFGGNGGFQNGFGQNQYQQQNPYGNQYPQPSPYGNQFQQYQQQQQQQQYQQQQPNPFTSQYRPLTAPAAQQPQASNPFQGGGLAGALG